MYKIRSNHKCNAVGKQSYFILFKNIVPACLPSLVTMMVTCTIPSLSIGIFLVLVIIVVALLQCACIKHKFSSLTGRVNVYKDDKNYQTVQRYDLLLTFSTFCNEEITCSDLSVSWCHDPDDDTPHGKTSCESIHCVWELFKCWWTWGWRYPLKYRKDKFNAHTGGAGIVILSLFQPILPTNNKITLLRSPLGLVMQTTLFAPATLRLTKISALRGFGSNLITIVVVPWEVNPEAGEGRRMTSDTSCPGWFLCLAKTA